MRGNMGPDPEEWQRHRSRIPPNIEAMMNSMRLGNSYFEPERQVRRLPPGFPAFHRHE